MPKPRWWNITISHIFFPMLHGRWSFLLLLVITISSLTFIPSFPITTSSMFQTATAAQALSLPSSLESTTIKVILSDSIQALKSGNISKTLQHLNVVDQKLATVKENSPSIQTISAYGAYSKDVGVVIPRGQTYYLALKAQGNRSTRWP